MIEKKEWSVVFEGRVYAGIKRLGFDTDGQFIVDLYPCPPPEPRGGYFTMLPISPLAYRREHGQSSRLGYFDDGSAFVILDEYGKGYRFELIREGIDQLVAECAENMISRKVSLRTGTLSHDQ